MFKDIFLNNKNYGIWKLLEMDWNTFCVYFKLNINFF